ncbi:hypothetical protein [uncultured Corynebacterium sp.]|uniref:hypothetical protein n=1 Tax=uncultured Corynebacterium sp. TaxID=159447 RepID=UPI002601522D|nr:hypothetical protein [uncultured Corynebacterium sp.]
MAQCAVTAVAVALILVLADMTGFFAACVFIGALWAWTFAEFAAIAIGAGRYFADSRGIPLLH